MESFSDYGIVLPTGAYGNVRAICPQCTQTRKPQHQKNKDLSVEVDKGTWLCHHCDWTGGLRKSNELYHRPQYTPKPPNSQIEKIMLERGIGPDTLKKCNIGYEKNAIMFPRYKNGACVGIKYRTIDKKMWQSQNPEPCFYNYDMAKNSGADTLIIVEGEIDCLTCVEAGFQNVVSVPDGAPSPNSKNLENKFKFLDDGFVGGFEKIILATDGDEPGLFLRDELAKKIGPHKCYRVDYPHGCKDLNDVLCTFSKHEVVSVINTAKPMPIDGLYSAGDMKQAVMGLYESGLKSGLSTGWASVDEFYTVRTCEMTIITGIPGSGKSTWLDALTYNVNTLHGWKIAYCSPENWPIARHIANIAEKEVKKSFIETPYFHVRMTKRELENAIRRIDGQFFFTQLSDNDMSIENILSVMQGAISRHGVKGIVLDPWNELEHHRPPNKNESEFISEALGKIRRFARLNDVHVWIVAHPVKLRRNDDGTYPVPRLYDISGSAHFYNKADNGVVIYRANQQKHMVDIYVQKVRFKEVGKIGNCELKFVKESGTYQEVTGSEHEYQNDSNPF